MIKALRIMRIKELLDEEGTVSLQHLCSAFNVSAATVRNDLLLLEREGVLSRTHGGAIRRTAAAANDKKLVSVKSSTTNLDRKYSEIGELVRNYVPDRAWVYFGYGSTIREISRHLSNRNINVVTDNVDAAIILGESKLSETFVPGGYLRKKNDYLLLGGEWHHKTIRDLSFDQTYLSVFGFDSMGYTIEDAEDCLTFELLRKNSTEVIIVIDSTKFDKTSFYRIGDIDWADTVITNDDIPPYYISLLKEKGVKLITPSSNNN